MNVAVPLNPALVCVENETGVLSKAVEAPAGAEVISTAEGSSME